MDTPEEIRYYDESLKNVEQVIKQDPKFQTVYGHNQLHTELAIILPCGNLNMDMAGDDYDKHRSNYHRQICNGMEHFDICSIPTNPSMKVYGTDCSMNCSVFFKNILEETKKVMLGDDEEKKSDFEKFFYEGSRIVHYMYLSNP